MNVANRNVIIDYKFTKFVIETELTRVKLLLFQYLLFDLIYLLKMHRYSKTFFSIALITRCRSGKGSLSKHGYSSVHSVKVNSSVNLCFEEILNIVSTPKSFCLLSTLDQIQI